ncbi:hypothetical protein BDV25DRAFT_146341 [Aspergillus avenaceus]|uniref:Uncharacterized protein n=1 Tax=Aspergillus avenaceus TaxID=36643 RepID=A0A5N6U9G7_ASPAV|nr:hypothetical protein BDV25DRAFT_146341 [Aspergillus avenaceus]
MFKFSAKRQRAYDEPDFDSSAIHHSKRHRPLPLHTSLGARSHSFTKDQSIEFGLSTLTPVESSDDEDGKHVPFSLVDPRAVPHQTARSHAFDTAMDIDHDRNIPASDQCQWPVNVGIRDIQPSPIPHSLVNQSLTISDRHSANPMLECARSTPNEPVMSPFGQVPTDAPATNCFGLRRLPSPVSDGEDGSTHCKDTASDVDMATPRRVSLSPSVDRNRISHMPRPNSSTDAVKPKQPKNLSKKKATVSMGYRADCEKCRSKIPGHYSHIIRV